MSASPSAPLTKIAPVHEPMDAQDRRPFLSRQLTIVVQFHCPEKRLRWLTNV